MQPSRLAPALLLLVALRAPCDAWRAAPLVRRAPALFRASTVCGPQQQQECQRTDWQFPHIRVQGPDALHPINGNDGANANSDANANGAREPTPSEEGGDNGGAVALGALASSALISEAIQVAGTGVLVYAAQQFTGAEDLTSAVTYLSHYFQALGPSGYALYAGIQIFLQVVPVASAFVLTVSAGVVFGSTAKATALVSAASTTSAALAFVIARYLLRDRILGLAGDNKTVLTLDRALAKADLGTSMLVIILLRSSPLLPFPWASYLFGISKVPFSAYILGSLLGTLPAIFAYVSAGQVGSEIVLSGTPPSWLVQLGLVATLGAVTLIGNLANSALKELDVDLED